MPRAKKHIELFAGCGGMSLGMEAAGFNLFLANELSPMAGETFAYNLLGEDLSKLVAEEKTSKNVLWIKSAYDKENLKDRLRENPFDYSKGRHSDINNNTDFSNKLVIGNIDHFLNFLAGNRTACRQLRNENIDLLSGGPPCQGFSLAGKREKDDYKNVLPLSFAKFAGLVQPKVVLLENVKGITSPFETDDGVKHYAWLEVAKAFALRGFMPVCMLINSKYFGVPQNRPRFILYAFRKDIFELLKERNTNTDVTNLILLDSLMFYKKVRNNRKSLDKVTIMDLNLYDIESDPNYFDGKLLPKILTEEADFITASQAIKDIFSTKRKYLIDSMESEYATRLNKLFKSKFDIAPAELQNHDQRNHSFKVQARFRLYQVLNGLNGMRQDAAKVISGKTTDEEIFRKVFTAFRDESLLIESDGAHVFDSVKSLSSFKEYLKVIESKKHSQRAIKSDEPAPAQMTIPDDLCHYASHQLRTLTVREMGRFQSFPDWFVFRSKVTTGGDQRSFEVPQYTQVGNAVPPILAFELGKTLRKMLNTIE